MCTISNSVRLVGHATQPIMDSDTNSATFKIAVPEDNNCITNVFDCIGYEDVARQICSNVKDGMIVAVEGSLRNHDYKDHTGLYCHTYTEVVVREVLPIKSK